MSVGYRCQAEPDPGTTLGNKTPIEPAFLYLNIITVISRCVAAPGDLERVVPCSQWSHTVRSVSPLHDWLCTFLPLLFKNHLDALTSDSRATWPGNAPHRPRQPVYVPRDVEKQQQTIKTVFNPNKWDMCWNSLESLHVFSVGKQADSSGNKRGE